MIVLAILAPAAVSMFVSRKYQSGFSVRSRICLYLIDTQIITWLTQAVLIYGLHAGEINAERFESFEYFITYTLVAVAIAVVWGVVRNLWHKHVKSTVTIDKKVG